MSQLFDALQRSEAERFGTDLSTLSGATELLQLAERHADTDQRKSSPLEESAGQTAEIERGFAPAGTVVESLKAREPRRNLHQSNPFSEFQNLQIAVPSDS